jgi:hypothetical protein
VPGPVEARRLTPSGANLHWCGSGPVAELSMSLRLGALSAHGREGRPPG